MHAPPTFQLLVRHFGVWRKLLTSVSFLLVAVNLLRAGSQSMDWVSLGLCAFSLVALWGLSTLWRHTSQPSLLSWDGQVWGLAPGGSLGGEARTGRAYLMLDAGPWMLLRFDPFDGSRRLWLPVQRLGHEADWHLLRCAVYGGQAVTRQPPKP